VVRRTFFFRVRDYTRRVGFCAPRHHPGVVGK
jgi:hypothetical protein